MDECETICLPNNTVIIIRRLLANDNIEEVLECFNDDLDSFDCPSTTSAFFHNDSLSFWIAIVKSSSKIVGVCGCPFGPNQTHFLGLYGVANGFRSFGIGTRLFQQCVSTIGDRNAGLYAVPKMLEKYLHQTDFKLKEGKAMISFRGVLNETILDDCDSEIDSSIKIIKFDRSTNQDDDLETKLIDFDSKVHQESRSRLLRFILTDSSYSTMVAVDKNNTDRIQGYGCLRQHSLSKRFYLGPLYIDKNGNDDNRKRFRSIVARMLVKELLRNDLDRIRSNGLIWNCIDANPDSLRLPNSFGLIECERCERLFTKHFIQANFEMIYAVFSPDFSL